VSFRRRSGSLLITVARQNDRSLHICLLLAFTAAFIFICSIFARTFLRIGASADILYLLPFFGVVVVWYAIVLLIGIWKVFGVEEISVLNGILLWRRKALWWSRNLEIPVSAITEVKAIAPWHSLSNRVEFTSRGQRHTIGRMLLREEVLEIAQELRRAAGL